MTISSLVRNIQKDQTDFNNRPMQKHETVHNVCSKTRVDRATGLNQSCGGGAGGGK